MQETRLYTPVLIIGSGIAGCTAALTLADAGIEVTLISAGADLDDGNTALAQGGIVFKGENDDPKSLEQDMLKAGWSHNYVKNVRFLCRKGPQAVHDILVDRLGIPFDRSTKCEWDLRLEGGHGASRIMHCADYTGRVIMDGLMRAVNKSRNIRVLTKRTAVDLLTSHHHCTNIEFKYNLVNQCVGAYVFNDESKSVETILSDFTVLATGGLGQIYLHTTNTTSCIGSGLTMAFRARAWVMNSEFVQFHPTALYHKARRRFLITEALRGEGARLVNSAGEPFMQKYDPRGDLAPRDIVTRAIMDEMLATGEPCVYLDAANYVSTDLEGGFPTVSNKCKEMNVDIKRQPIPVVPAAHYFIGGVLADVKGQTTLERLYAIGECSCTGVHGANRLASTSLLEGLVWGNSAGHDVANRLSKKSPSALSRRLRECVPDWESPGGMIEAEDPALIAQDWTTLRNTMWNYAGVTRTGHRLQRAVDDLRNLYRHLHDFYKRTPLSKTLVDLFHGSQAAYIVSVAALRNKKSIGCHYRMD